MFDFNPLHDAEFAAFGDKGIFHLPSGDVELDVILRDMDGNEHLGKHVPMVDHSHELDVRSADIAINQISIRQKVTVRGDDYTIIKPKLDEDADGMTVFIIRRYGE